MRIEVDACRWDCTPTPAPTRRTYGPALNADVPTAEPRRATAPEAPAAAGPVWISAGSAARAAIIGWLSLPSELGVGGCLHARGVGRLPGPFLRAAAIVQRIDGQTLTRRWAQQGPVVCCKKFLSGRCVWGRQAVTWRLGWIGTMKKYAFCCAVGFSISAKCSKS